MEAVNKVITTASHAIWGDNDAQSQQAQQSHDEPISGVQGKGSATDPYDAGNRDDTAPKEPKLDGQPQTSVSQPAASTTFAPTYTTDAPSAIPTTDAPSVAATAAAPSASAATHSSSTTAAADSSATPAEPSASGATHSSSTTAAAGSSATPAEDTSATSKTESKEQREPEDPEKTKQQMEAGRRGTAAIMHDHGVSKEALKGPQDGQVAHSAAEFEKEGKHGAKDLSTESKGESGKSTTSKGSDKSSGSGKQGAMSKMKEGLKKVVHPHSSKQSSQ
ncbi:hypothetical protein N7523_003911 [Penicillium sp. IBT 18751x]|nr:hypothetical protein N7523_003911 [Penicillium sp. IBT 18751x]